MAGLTSCGPALLGGLFMSSMNLVPNPGACPLALVVVTSVSIG